MMMGDEMYIFPNVNTVIEFTYSKYQIREKFEYNFSLSFELIMTKPENMDSFVYTAINIANNMQMKKLSYYNSFVIPDQHVPENTLNEIINDINKHFFQFEEFITEKMPANLKNPVDESVNPMTVTDNKSSVMSLINKERNVGTIAFGKKNTDNEIVKLVNSDPELNTIFVNSNPHNLWIVYRKGSENEANELKKLYDDNGGFITPHSPGEVQRREGELLGYGKMFIDDFITNKVNRNI
jgi:hypothetical protein